jgi:hypothetical protein
MLREAGAVSIEARVLSIKTALMVREARRLPREAAGRRPAGRRGRRHYFKFSFFQRMAARMRFLPLGWS